MKTLDLSIIIPVFNEEKNIQPLYDQLKNVLTRLKLTHEILFVNDGSKDKTAEITHTIIHHDPTVKLITLRKHFGKADALATGFAKARGTTIITMDGDLQDDPCEIPRFIHKLHQGYDVVSGWKYHRKDPLTKTIPSLFFNKLTRVFTGIRIHDFNCGFKAYTTEAAKNITLYGELHRYIPALCHWNGFKVGEIKVIHHPRKYGTSKYGITRMFTGLIDLLTIKYLTTYLERPLHLFASAGALLFTFGFIAGLYLTYLWFINITIWNRPLLSLAVLLMVLGVQFLFTGLIGEMIINLHRKNEQSIERKIKSET